MTIKPESIPSDVVEKAARALCLHSIGSDESWRGYTDDARAALAAGLEAVAERVAAEAEQPSTETDVIGQVGYLARRDAKRRAARLIRFEE